MKVFGGKWIRDLDLGRSLVSLGSMWLSMMIFRMWRRSLVLTCEKRDIFGLVDFFDR